MGVIIQTTITKASIAILLNTTKIITATVGSITLPEKSRLLFESEPNNIVIYIY
jgi:hypothetical protein